MIDRRRRDRVAATRRRSVAWRGSSAPSMRSISARAIAMRAGPLRRTTPMPPRPGGVAMATMVSVVENTSSAIAADRCLALETGCLAATCVAEIMTVFENASPMLSVVDAGNFGDRQVHDAALVGIQRAELLIDARSPSPSRRGTSPSAAARCPCPCGSRARRRRRACSSSSVRPNAMSTTCCSALSGSPRCRTSSSASSPVEVEARAVGGLLDVDGRRHARAPRDTVQEIDDRLRGCRVMRQFSSRGAVGLAAADALHAPLGRRAGRCGRSAGRSGSSSAYCWPIAQRLLTSQ